MSNKLLAAVSVAPVYMAAIMGAASVDNEALYTILGLWMMIFATWASIRLWNFES